MANLLENVFDSLRKLFSSDVIIRNVGGKKLKAIDTHSQQLIGNLSTNYLRSKYSNLYSTVAGGYNQSVTIQAQRLMLFRDYELMEQDPIIASALDLYAEECLGPNTIIPLLNGEKLSIKELFDTNRQNFWVYSIDDKGKFVPEKCERVKYNGKKEMYVFTLEDGTKIESSANHKWLDSNTNKLKYTTEFKVGDGIKAHRTKISSGYINGYEMIKETKGWKYTHKLVAETILKEEKQKLDKNERHVVHHKSYNKLNNDPNELEWMTWEQHKKYHSENNSERWRKDKKYSNKMRKILSTEAKKKLNNIEFRRKFTEGKKKWMSKLTIEDKKRIYGRKGKQNGMYGKNLSGSNNGNYNKNVNRISDIIINEYLNVLVDNKLNNSKLSNKFNLLPGDINKINKMLCKQYNVKTKKGLYRKINNLKLKKYLSIDILKYEIDLLEENNINPYRNINIIAEKYNTTTVELTRFINEYGYKTFYDLINSNNHKIIKIEKIGMQDAYDLINVGKFHTYAIESNDGSKLYCHNCTIKNEFGQVLTIKSDDGEIKEVLENLFYDILNIDFNLQHWVRNLVKYGDWFMKLEIADRLGIINVIPFSAYDVTREEGLDINNPHHVQFKIEGASITSRITLEKYEMAHFRLLNDSNFLPYGKSMIEGSRRIWKQLSLMEDAMLIHRIMRAPQKRIFKIDVGNLHPNEVEAYMQQIINNIKKVPYIDSQTGEYNLQYNIQNITEDFYLPIRSGESETNIDTLSGLEYQAIDDIEYLRNKLMASLRIPKAFLGYEEGLSSKSTLSAEDIRFARTIERIQRIVVSELTNIAVVHLFVQGYRDEDLVSFDLSLTSPSIIYEQEKLEMWTQKVSLADSMKEQKLMSSDWIYEHIFNISEDEKKEQRSKIIEDTKREYRIEQIKLEGNDPAKTGQHVDDDGTVRGVNDPDDIDVQGNGSDNPNTDSSDVGRPPESVNKRGTDKSNFGRDTIGKKDNKKGSFKPDKTTGLDFKGRGPLGTEVLSSLSSLTKKYPAQYKRITILGENIKLLNGKMNDLIENEDDEE